MASPVPDRGDERLEEPGRMVASKARIPRRDERRPAVFVEDGGDDEAPTLGLWDCDLDRVVEDVDARDGMALQRLDSRGSRTP